MVTGASYPDQVPGPNGVTKAGMTFHARALPPTSTPGAPTATATTTATGPTAADPATFALVSNETGRCLGLRPYVQGSNYAVRDNVPMLLECSDKDATQAWVFPTGPSRVGAIQSVWALRNNHSATVLAVGNSTLFGAPHGDDKTPLLDAAYGDTVLMLSTYAPEPECHGRNCTQHLTAMSPPFHTRFCFTG